MLAIKTKNIAFHADGTTDVQAIILSDDTPAALPTNGSEVTGMNATQHFAPGSIIYVTADVTPKIYIANESGNFVPQ